MTEGRPKMGEGRERVSVLLLFVALLVPFGVFAQDAAQTAREIYLRGKLYYEQGQYRKANEEFEKSLDLLRKSKTEAAAALPEPAATVASEPPEPRDLKPGEYYIGDNDVLQISVWQHEDLTGEVLVRPDGKISLPLAGDIQAVGRTIPELDALITEKLAEFIVGPQVSISIRKIGGQRVMVLGEVLSPGVYELMGSKNVLEAISMAKGFTPSAVVSSVIVVRGGFEKPEGIRLDLNKPLLHADMSQNIPLQPEDIVYVPKKFIANVNYFVNQLIAPIIQGSYSVMDYRSRTW